MAERRFALALSGGTLREAGGLPCSSGVVAGVLGEVFEAEALSIGLGDVEGHLDLGGERIDPLDGRGIGDIVERDERSLEFRCRRDSRIEQGWGLDALHDVLAELQVLVANGLDPLEGQLPSIGAMGGRDPQLALLACEHVGEHGVESDAEAVRHQEFDGVATLPVATHGHGRATAGHEGEVEHP